MSEENEPVAINVRVLIETHRHLAAALQLIQTQPSAGPLVTVQVNIVAAEAVLDKAIKEITAQAPRIQTANRLPS